MRSPSLQRLLFGSACVGGVALLWFVFQSTRSAQRRAETPQEFVEKSAAAYRAKDVDAVLALTATPKILEEAGVSEEIREAVASYRAEEHRKEVAQEFQRGGLFYDAWCRTRFAEAREHGGHIHVTVSIEGARSELVLVREGGLLKIHPFPSLFD